YAQRLTDLQGELVRSHRLTDIGTIERLERSLRLFADRVRVATYGYGGLFSDRSIDERALDQLQAFDRALGDGLDEVRSGGQEQGLHVPPSTREPRALLQRSSESPGDGQQVTVGGRTFTRAASGAATAEVVGEGGTASGRSVQYRRYSGDGGALLFVYDWGT